MRVRVVRQIFDWPHSQECDSLAEMRLETTKKHWDQLGAEDPFWAVLTDPSKKGGRWDPAEFFQTGVDEIGGVMAELTQLTGTPPRTCALDFGCGVGRLSQALSRHFEKVHGVDISPSMLEHASRFNQFPDKCQYHLNDVADLRLFPENQFDFVCSVITLQHMAPQYAMAYVREFFRVLRPGGIAFFQVITAAGWRRLIPNFVTDFYRRLKHGDKAFVGAFGIPEQQLAQLLAEVRAEVLDLRRGRDPSGRWASLRYLARKKGT